MAIPVSRRLSHAWNAFRVKEDNAYYLATGPGYSGTMPHKPRLTRGNDRSIVNSIYTRLAIDIASNKIRHVRVDENDNFIEIIDSGLDYCFNIEANIDQSGRQLIQDIAMSLFDEGVVAIIPIDTKINPAVSGSYEIETIRTGQVIEWFCDYVRVRSFNEKTQQREDLLLPKKQVAIVENPLYSVMNEPNSTLQRLVRKLNLLDAIDDQSGSGKLDLILQMPYQIKTQAKVEMAKKRLVELEKQLSNSKYGIGYIDGTEKITQLNRAVENNLMQQVEYLTVLLYNQLGMAASVFDGTADEATMLNYYERSVAPVLNAIAESCTRTFLTKTAVTQRQRIKWLSNPFKLLTAEKLSEIADKFTRNEILTSNELRGSIGFYPSKDPKADKLINSNLNQSNPNNETKKGETDE